MLGKTFLLTVLYVALAGGCDGRPAAAAVLPGEDAAPSSLTGGPTGEDPGEDEPDPDPLSEVDEPGGSFREATPLIAGAGVDAAMNGGWPADHDVFVFVLAEAAEVVLSVSGVELRALLYDAGPVRLRTAESRPGETLQLVEALPAGTYYLRLTSEASGAYRLRFDVR